MAKARKKEILSYDPIIKRAYKLADNLLTEVEGKLSSSYSVSFIPGNLIKYASININDDTEDSSEAVANKAYEELDLSIETDYQIRYALSDGRGVDGGDMYNVFSVETSVIESTFKELVDKISYIDYIDFEPMLYSAYYSSGTFSSQGVDIYIYMHKTYATLTVYKEGEICAFRCVNKLSIDALHAAYCHELAERIPEHVFVDELNKYGLDHIDDGKRVSLNKVFSDACMVLVNNIAFVLRQLRMENEAVSMIAVGSDLGLTSNILQKFKVLFARFKNVDADSLLEAMLENSAEQTNDSLIASNFVNLQKQRYELFKNSKNFSNENEGSSLSPFVMMSLLRAHEQMKEANGVFNVSTFLRPPPFAKRSSGQLFLAVIAVLILAGIYPTVNYVNGYIAAQQAEDTNLQVNVKQQVYNKLKAQIEQLNAQIKALDEQISSEQSRLSIRNGLLNGLYDKKVNYLSKAKLLTELTTELNKSKVYVENLSLNTNMIKLKLVGSNASVTDFVRNLGSNSNYEILSKELNIMSEGGQAKSELEIRMVQ